MEKLKLYEIPEKSTMKIKLDPDRVDICTFHRIDGMYSYCTTSDGSVFHLSASTPMVKKDSWYEIEGEFPVPPTSN